MAVTDLTDIYDAEGFANLIDEKSTAKNAFVQSGVMIEDENINALAGQAGKIGALPFYGPIADNDPNISSDDPATNSTPDKISQLTQLYRIAALNKSWSAMTLARELATKDPVEAITNGIANYWVTVRNKRLIASMLGVLADNVANDSGDMRYSIATDTNSAVTDAEKISADAIVMAAGTSGDKQDIFVAIAMHSALYTQLKRANLIDYLRDSEGNKTFPVYLGYIVVVDDACPAIAGTYRITYTSILFGMGSIAHGKGKVLVPSELERKPSAGNGGGQDILYSRVSEIIHPYGHSFLSASVSGDSATLAELKTAANWNRVYQRKNINLAFLQTNG